jgi:hypothetical protein
VVPLALEALKRNGKEAAEIRMSGKHRKTLAAVFTDPPSPNLDWWDIERLFTACGAAIASGRGSRVRVKLNGVLAVFHRPHPQPVTGKGAVKSVRHFLESAGIRP